MNQRLFYLPDSEIRAYGEMNLIYGSLTPKGIQTTVQVLKKYTREESIVGFDLGCGDGELIYQLSQQLPGSVWEGVEISEHRVSMQCRDVTIWQGDMLHECLRSYNVLHADNLCLEDSIAEMLEEKIVREFQGLYITYRTPASVSFLRNSVHLESVPTETTWTIHPIQYFYINPK
jgi:hypothetical protein